MGVSDELTAKILRSADDRIIALDRMVRRDRLEIGNAIGRARRCVTHRHRRTPGNRPVRRGGSRRCASTRGSPPDDSDPTRPRSGGGR